MKKTDCVLTLVQFKLLYRNKRTKDILDLIILSGVSIWGMFIYEFLFDNSKFSYINSSFITILTIVSFILPISFSSNVFSFYYYFFKSSFSMAYEDETLIKNILSNLILSNLFYNLFFLLPLFYLNNEILYLVSLTSLGTGVFIPISILISSVKITSIDLSKSKTYNYSGINIYIILLTILTLFICGLFFIVSNIIFNNYVILPIILGCIGIIIFPVWIRLITYRLKKIKLNFDNI